MANLSELMTDSARKMGASPMGMQADDVECAETDGKTLFYNHQFMADLEGAAGSDGVRFVVAHELGHRVGGMEVGGHTGEFMADEYAARCLARSGASFASISAVFSFLGSDSSAEHPSSSSRVEHAHKHFVNAKEELAESSEVPTKLDNEKAHKHDLAI